MSRDITWWYFTRMKKYQANSYRENEVQFTDTDLRSFGTDVLESNILPTHRPIYVSLNHNEHTKMNTPDKIKVLPRVVKRKSTSIYRRGLRR